MTPCKRKEDFLPDHIRYSGCWIHPSPDETQCHSLGCTWHETWCECKTKASCDAAGGVYHESNCTSETSWWQPAVHKGIKEALDKSDCSGVMAGWGELEYQVSYLDDCCSSGKDICEDGEPKTPLCRTNLPRACRALSGRITRLPRRGACRERAVSRAEPKGDLREQLLMFQSDCASQSCASRASEKHRETPGDRRTVRTVRGPRSSRERGETGLRDERSILA
eukprot:g10550.t1